MTNPSIAEKEYTQLAGESTGLHLPIALIAVCDGHLHDALVLRQIIFWHEKAANGQSRLRARGGEWLSKSYHEFYRECGVVEKTVRKSIARLAKKGLIRKQRFSFARVTRMHMQLAWGRLAELTREVMENCPLIRRDYKEPKPEPKASASTTASQPAPPDFSQFDSDDIFFDSKVSDPIGQMEVRPSDPAGHFYTETTISTVNTKSQEIELTSDLQRTSQQDLSSDLTAPSQKNDLLPLSAPAPIYVPQNRDRPERKENDDIRERILSKKEKRSKNYDPEFGEDTFWIDENPDSAISLSLETEQEAKQELSKDSPPKSPPLAGGEKNENEKVAAKKEIVQTSAGFKAVTVSEPVAKPETFDRLFDANHKEPNAVTEHPPVAANAKPLKPGDRGYGHDRERTRLSVLEGDNLGVYDQESGATGIRSELPEVSWPEFRQAIWATRSASLKARIRDRYGFISFYVAHLKEEAKYNGHREILEYICLAREALGLPTPSWWCGEIRAQYVNSFQG